MQGVVRGTVKIVMGASKIGKVKKGDIIVAPMTTPDYLPAMKKAKAIDTDECGLTCHAAIISRDLSISCIIVTRIATKVLKNVDLIEIDAKEGVEKILKMILRKLKWCSKE